jgi:hypothetical protein
LELIGRGELEKRCWKWSLAIRVLGGKEGGLLLLRVNDGTDLVVERLALIGNSPYDCMVRVVACAPNPEEEDQRKSDVEPSVVRLSLDHLVYGVSK